MSLVRKIVKTSSSEKKNNKKDAGDIWKSYK